MRAEIHGLCVATLVVAGCSGSDGTATADAGDAGSASSDAVIRDVGAFDGSAARDAARDASSVDAVTTDAAPDGGAGDASLDAGPGPIGSIHGTCGVLDDTELLGAGPFLFENHIDFPNGYTDADATRLSAGGQEILADGNLGGSSLHSEIFAYEVLERCEMAALLKTEGEISYDMAGSITDLLVSIDGHRIGVSVTRAFRFPPTDPYTVEQATLLLEDKLTGVLESSANVSAMDAWVKQILVVMAYEPMHADSVRAAWEILDAGLKADTIVWVTVTDGDDLFMY